MLSLGTLFEALGNSVPGLTFKGYASSDHLHGSLETGSAKDFLEQWIRSAPSLGTVSGAGVAFRYDAFGDTLWSSLTLDESSVLAGRLYIGLFASWDGTKVSSEDLPTKAAGLTSWAIERLGLCLKETQ